MALWGLMKRQSDAFADKADRAAQGIELIRERSRYLHSVDLSFDMIKAGDQLWSLVGRPGLQIML